ncbi:ankyrin repeat-containing domain protein [Obelidium mucronatum]|nr:ankyrin repeat-containing domain protein [Obelidium mucronatum]
MAPAPEDIAATNLFIAASDGDLELVQYFLENGNKVTDQDDLGYSVFHAAASYNHIEMMEYLLAQLGPSTTMPVDVDGDTPLHVTETVEMAKLLISHTPTLPLIANNDGVLPIDNADEEGFQACCFIFERKLQQGLRDIGYARTCWIRAHFTAFRGGFDACLECCGFARWW